MDTKINYVENITTAFVLFCFGDPKTRNGGKSPLILKDETVRVRVRD